MIELIVVMAIVAVLVLIAAPRFLGRTNDAVATSIQHDVRIAEDRMTELLSTNPDALSEWVEFTPALTSSEEDETQLFGRGGPMHALPEGTYYTIDDAFLDDAFDSQLSGTFITNEEGDVFYEHPNFTSIESPDSGNTSTGVIDVKEYENDDQEIVFLGGHANMFDGDMSTSYRNDTVVTWEGNLTHREIEITAKGGSALQSNRSVYFYFRDDDGNDIPPVGSTNPRFEVRNRLENTTITRVVPEGATSLHIEHELWSARGSVYNISAPDTLERHAPVPLNVASHLDGFTFDWASNKVVTIYENGRLMKTVEGSSTKVVPFDLRDEYVYDFFFIDDAGNGRQITNTVTRGAISIAASDFRDAVFDGNLDTSSRNDGVIHLGSDLAYREITITGRGGSALQSNRSVYFYFRDDEGNNIPAVGTTAARFEVRNRSENTTVSRIIPEGATSLHIEHELATARGNVYDISLPSVMTRPEAITVQATSHLDGYTFEWGRDKKVSIYEDGQLRKTVEGTGTSLLPLNLQESYTYDFVLVDEYGNGQLMSETVQRGNVAMASEVFTESLFDNNLDTFNRNSGVIYLGEDMVNRSIDISASAGSSLGSTRSVYFYFRDDEGNNISPVGSTAARLAFSSVGTVTTQSAIVPDGATQLHIEYQQNLRGDVRNIRVPDSLERPSVPTISATSYPEKIAFEWEENSQIDSVYIYEDGRYVMKSEGTSEQVLPHELKDDYTYDFIFMDANGNGHQSTQSVAQGDLLMASTVFNYRVVDGNTETSANLEGSIALSPELLNRPLNVTVRAGYSSRTLQRVYVSFTNQEGEYIPGVGTTNSRVTFADRFTPTTERMVVPEGATHLLFEHASSLSTGRGFIYNVEVAE